MNGPVRWGIMGAGSMGTRFARDLAHTPAAKVEAIASGTLGRAAQLTVAAGVVGQGARALADYTSLVADPQVDAIYIATPTHLHREHALLAIAAGKAVLCEKPLAGSLEDAEAIAQAARSAGVFCMEALWTRFLPTFRLLEQRIAELGTLRRIDVSLGFPRKQQAGDLVTDPALGGGALHDLGVYPLALATALVGELRLNSSWVRGSDVADWGIRDAQAMLLAQNGTLPVTIAVSHSTLLSNRFEITGDTGRLVIDAPFIEALGLRHLAFAAMDHRTHDNPSPLSGIIRRSRVWPVLRGLRRGFDHPDGMHLTKGYNGTGLQFQAQEVQRCLERGLIQSPLLPLEISVGVQRLVAQIADDDIRTM